MNLIEWARIIIGLVVTTWLPGFCLSLMLWPTESWLSLKRLVFSIILSITLVPGLVYLVNRLGMPFNLYTIIGTIAIISGVGITGYLIKKHKLQAT